MDILAREARHGDGLRMSTSGKKRDPLLDEDEDDWVRTSIIAGWSHGYLQMVSLLPAAEKVIAMHADWIVEAFETAAAKELGQQQIGLSAPDRNASFSRTVSKSTTGPSLRVDHPTNGVLPNVQAVNVIPPTPVITDSVALAPSTTPSPQKDTLAVQHGSSALSDAEDDDDILTFTPKNRRSSSNASRSSKSGGASPPVPPYKTSPPTLSPSADELVESLTSDAPAPKHLVTTVERAMRDEQSHGQLPLGSASSAPASRPITPSRRPIPARQTSGPSPPASSRTSRPERALSLSPPLSATPRTGRSPSSSALPPPQGAVFIDARDLMRRRKEDVVYGIVSGAGSRTSSPLPGCRTSDAARPTPAAAHAGHDAQAGAALDSRKTFE